MNNKFLMSSVAALALSTSSYAGDYVYGVWNANVDTAMQTAFAMADAKTQKSGCIGRGRGDTTTQELIMEQQGDQVRFGVFISFHDKSCGIKRDILTNMSNATGIDFNRIGAAWLGQQ